VPGINITYPSAILVLPGQLQRVGPVESPSLRSIISFYHLIITTISHIHTYMVSHFKTTTWISRQESRQSKNNLYKSCWVCRGTSNGDLQFDLELDLQGYL